MSKENWLAVLGVILSTVFLGSYALALKCQPFCPAGYMYQSGKCSDTYQCPSSSFTAARCPQVSSITCVNIASGVVTVPGVCECIGSSITHVIGGAGTPLHHTPPLTK